MQAIKITGQTEGAKKRSDRIEKILTIIAGMGTVSAALMLWLN